MDQRGERACVVVGKEIGKAILQEMRRNKVKRKVGLRTFGNVTEGKVKHKFRDQNTINLIFSITKGKTVY